jgi:hypothetical protein
VKIQWKKDRDLTGGLLDLVCKAWEVEKAVGEKRGLSSEQKQLKTKIENTGMGGLSFFAWFGFIGRHITAEESAQATKLERERRVARKKGETPKAEENEDEDEDGEEDMSLEIFSDGDDLAVAISEDLWPGAIRYFSEFQVLLSTSRNVRELTNAQHKHRNKMRCLMRISNRMTSSWTILSRIPSQKVKNRQSGQRRNSVRLSALYH